MKFLVQLSLCLVFFSVTMGESLHLHDASNDDRCPAVCLCSAPAVCPDNSEIQNFAIPPQPITKAHNRAAVIFIPQTPADEIFHPPLA